MWRSLVKQTGLAITIALLVALLPLPVWTPDWFTYFQVPVIVAVLICYLGKLLYDTLFWDRYHPGK